MAQIKNSGESQDRTEQQEIVFDFKPLGEIYFRGLPLGFRNQILEMAFESRDTYQAKCYRATIILAAETLFRANCEFVLQYTQVAGEIEYKRPRRKNIFVRANDYTDTSELADDLLDKLTFCDSIYLLTGQGLIDESLALDMHALRHLRNHVVHGPRYPFLFDHDPDVELTSDVIEDIVRSGLIERKRLPPKYVKYRFKIRIGNNDIDYIVDPVKLEIDIEALSRDSRFAVISLAIMFWCLKQIGPEFPRAKAIDGL